MFEKVSYSSEYGIICRKRYVGDALIDFGAVTFSGPNQIRTLAIGIASDNVEVVAGTTVLVAHACWYDDDITWFDNESHSDGVSKPDRRCSPIDTENLVCVAVIVRILVDAPAPGGVPPVLRIQVFESHCGFVTAEVNGRFVDHERQCRIVGDVTRVFKFENHRVVLVSHDVNIVAWGYRRQVGRSVRTFTGRPPGAPGEPRGKMQIGRVRVFTAMKPIRLRAASTWEHWRTT